jgi:hypothetical protein
VWQIVYLLRTRRVPPPPKVEGRLTWTAEDLPRLRDELAKVRRCGRPRKAVPV